MRYHLIPFGCQMNVSDSERIVTVLEEMGYEGTDNEEDADILGIVACSVRQKAIDKVYSKIHKWNEWKSARNLLTFVSGCVLPADREKFLRRFDLVFTINELPNLPEMIRQYGVMTPVGVTSAGLHQGTVVSKGGTAKRMRVDPPGTRRMIIPTKPEESGPDIRDGFWHVEPTYTSSFEAYVPIQNGCDKFCTFCAVPYTRGREISRPSGEILEEVSTLIEKGYRSITLLGQNVNSYGLDRRSGEMSFASLLHQIGDLTRNHPVWIYFTSPHPRDMGDDVLEAVAAHPTLANQIHLPIQSGDDKILIRMNRNYRVSGYREVVRSVRRILPEATLFTDIIVGFSGETDQQFRRTADAMEEFEYDMAYIAMYSPRPGAASSRWADDVDQDEKKHRLHVLTDILQRTAGKRNQRMIGKRIPVLVEGIDRQGFPSGRTEGRIPVRIELPSGRTPPRPGEFVTITVTDARPLSLYGKAEGL